MHDRTLALLTLLFFGSELTLAIAMAYSFADFRAGRLPFPPSWIRAGALMLFVGGLSCRWWAVITLGKFFTVDVATHDDHALVVTGPFRFVRHPSYTGLLLSFLGFGVSLGNALSVVVLMTPIVAALWYRMRVEEDALRQALGAAYDAYCARTKRLIPGVV